MRDYAQLHIVEAMHGCRNKEILERLNRCLLELKKRKNEIAIYAQHWIYHIQTERGIFPIDEYKKLLKKLNATAQVQMQSVHTEIKKRTFTDLLRCFHMQFKESSEDVLIQFIQFLDCESAELRAYYSALYINANRIHYIEIPQKAKTGEGDLADLIEQANQFYLALIAYWIKEQLPRLTKQYLLWLLKSYPIILQ